MSGISRVDPMVGERSRVRALYGDPMAAEWLSVVLDFEGRVTLEDGCSGQSFELSAEVAADLGAELRRAARLAAPPKDTGGHNG